MGSHPKFKQQKRFTLVNLILKWGGQWDSNPRISEPQSEALTAWRCPPSLIKL